jgi:crotonobetainyl-CoA:carnitine CoA-transferase CaiB-like acyl-CoA transferase
MQDAAAWITQWQRAGLDNSRRACTVRCADGYVAVEGTVDAAMARAAADRTRAALVERLAGRGITAAAVHSIAEVAESAQARSRRLLRRVRDSAGREWPVFASPIRLQDGSPRSQSAIGPLGEAGEHGFDAVR